MGILDRINTLIRANINDLVHRSDEPERALDQSIGEMESSTREARAQLRLVERQEAELIQRYERSREEEGAWDDKAMVALRAGDEGLARECLVMKKRAESASARLRDEIERQRTFVADLSRSLDALEVKLDATRSRRHSISTHVRNEPTTIPSTTIPGGALPHTTIPGGALPSTASPGADSPASAPSGGYTFPTFSSSPSTTPGRRERRLAPAEERFGEGRRAFVFDEDMRRQFPEEVFGASRPFEAFSDMEDRIAGLEAGSAAARELSGLEDPLRDDLEERFRRLSRDRQASEGLEDLRQRAAAPDPPPERAKDGGGKPSDLRRRLSEELDG